MTPKERTIYIERYDRFLRRYERIFTPRINAVLKAQVQYWKMNGSVYGMPTQAMYDELVHIYKVAGVQWAAKTQALLPKRRKARMPIGFNERIVELMREYYGIDLLSDATEITNTTVKEIQRVLAEAAISGLSYDEIVRQLESPSFTRIRARLIARTETATAANSAAKINASESGLNLNKIWIAARDNRTRHDHREVNGHTVAMDEPFVVGGEKMQQPGDKSASAKQRCNCRCAVAFEEV